MSRIANDPGPEWNDAMDNTVFISLSHQMAMRRSMDVIANNLANMSTTAFKREGMMFKEFLMTPKGAPPSAQNKVAFVQDVGVSRDMEAGEIVETGNTLDFAINGKGFFTLSAPNGEERYTRSGHFHINEEGRLMTTDGLPVLNEVGREITLNPQDSSFTVASDGTITTSQGAIGRLKLVRFAEDARLEKIGSTQFITDATPRPATGAKVIQGSYESSNVQPILEMTHMIEVLRGYQTTSRIMKDYNDLERSAIQKLGKVA